MPHSRTLKNLIYRVHITPAPRTQSESSAILRYLHDLGPISTFKVARPSLPATSPREQDGHASEAHATLIFARDTKALQDLRHTPWKGKFKVTANADIPSAAVKDPYNAQGLQTRKPELPPRQFRCRLQRLETQPMDPWVADQSRRNEYADTFTVDRSSIFGEILARTDVPSGLIHGLLPRVDDGFRDQPLGSNTVRNHQEFVTEIEHEEEHYLGQGDGEDITFRSLNSTKGLGRSSSIGRERHTRAPGPSPDDGAAPRDKFAVLKDFSLMGMYRDAISKDASSTSDTSKR